MPRGHVVKQEVVLGRKFCNGCGVWRHQAYFPPKRKQIGGEEKVYVQGTCESCRRLHYKNRYASDPKVNERQRANAKRWREENLDRIRAQRSTPEYRKRDSERRRRKYGVTTQRQVSLEERNARRRELYRWKVENDPVWVADRREYNRIYQEAKRREAGIQPRTRAIESRLSKSKVKEAELPAAPLVQWLQEKVSNYESWEAFAGACDINSRTLRRYIVGYEIDKNGNRREITHVPITTIDHILTNEGSTFLWELFPELGH